MTVRYGGEEDTVKYEVRSGKVTSGDDVFHLSTPPVRWWDNVIFACSTFLPFRSKADIDPWCRAHDLPRGAVMSVELRWRFAQDWYGGYLEEPWRKRSPAEVREVFARNGLTGPFWAFD